MNPTRAESNNTQEKTPKVLWRGVQPVYQTNVVSLLFWPLALAKRLVQGLYNSLIRGVWSELIHGEPGNESSTSALGFALLGVFAVVIYQIRAYEDWVILGVALVWVVDWWLSRAGFKHPARVRRSVASLRDKELHWKSVTPGGASAHARIPIERIDYVALDCIEIRLGAFHNRVGQVWRGLLVLDDGEGYALFDEPDITTAMQKAEEAAQTFKTRLRVSDTLGESALAADQRFNRALFLLDRDRTISTRTLGARVRIDKRLCPATATRCVGRVLSDAGFPFFLLLVYFMLLRVGAFLSAFLHPYIGLPAEPVVVDLSVAGIAGFLTPDMDWLPLIEFGAAFGFIGFKAWQFSRPVTVHVNQNVLQVRVGKKQLGWFDTMRITDFLLVQAPVLKLLIVDDQRRVIELNSLETDFEYKHVMARLSDAVSATRQRKKLSLDKRAA